MKIRSREKINPIILMPDDTISLTYEEEITTSIGKMGESKTQILNETKISRKMIIDETVIFDVEPGDFNDKKSGIGGAFLEQL